MLLVIFIHLVIFLTVCWEIWQVHLYEKFTLIFDLTEWLLLDDKIYQSSTSSNRINLSSGAKSKVCLSLIWRKFNKNLNCRTVFFNECLEFCFMGIIKQELDQVKQIHNTHRIRTYPNQECPTGRPNLIYNVPENFGKFISCFEGFHRYFKNSITPNFIILHLSLFSLSFFIF